MLRISLIIITCFSLFFAEDSLARQLGKFKPASDSQKDALVEKGIISVDDAGFLRTFSMPPLTIYRIENPDKCVRNLCRGIISAPMGQSDQIVELPITEYIFRPHNFSNITAGNLPVFFTGEAGCGQASVTYVEASHFRIEYINLGENCGWKRQRPIQQ